MNSPTGRTGNGAGLGLTMATALVVVTVEGFELSRSRGGACGTSCPVQRDAA